MRSQSFIVGAKRSPIAPRGGVLSALNLHQLSTPVIQALLSSVQIDANEIDDIIVGNALGAGGNPARVVGLASGLNESVAGLSIDRQCCSGLDAVLLASDMIKAGRASILIAGGVESYSQRPQRFQSIPGSSRLQAYDQPAFTPWPERDPDMATAANALAQKLGITFSRQNQWAIQSHEKGLSAIDRMTREVVPVANTHTDTYARKLSAKLCERATRIHGDISVANTSVAADGAAYCLVVSEAIASCLHGRKLLIRAGVTRGADPALPGLAPVAAIQHALSTAGVSADQLSCTEIMEAYAAQAIACVQQTGLDPQTCNLGGGSLARGHPIGASGAVLLTRLFSELSLLGGTGLSAIAAAGGLGTALVVEAV